jgi:hypothetical protein
LPKAQLSGLKNVSSPHDGETTKLRAERRIGEFSRELPSLGHRPKASHDGELKSNVLKDAGITHKFECPKLACIIF